MAAHNEEKIISKSLQSLLNVPYENYEVIIGLDGCTDSTEKIVCEFEKKSKKFRHYNLNLRQGKPAVINSIIKKAKGSIIIIQDADWIFDIKDKASFLRFISVFRNKKIGGIADAFSVDWEEEKVKQGNWTYKMVAYSSELWIDFQKRKYAGKKGEIYYLKEPAMFLTNIFRKELYENNSMLGDDFERTYSIIGKRYDIVFFDNINMPRMISTYTEIQMKDLFKQKIRTAAARNQLKNRNIKTKKYSRGAIAYMLRNSWKYGISAGILTISWIFITGLASCVSKFKKLDTKKGWTLRMRR